MPCGVGRLGATLPTRVHGRVKYTSLAEPELGIVYLLGPTALRKWISRVAEVRGKEAGTLATVSCHGTPCQHTHVAPPFKF